MKKYSIFLNSRFRTNYLINLLNSIKNTTFDLDCIECFINYDDDDHYTDGLVEHFSPNWPFCSFIKAPRDRNLHRRLNSILPLLTGEYIWILNDDTEIITENWDLESSKILPNGYNNIIYGHTICTSVDKEQAAEYSSFPIISHKSVNILGYYITEKLPGLGGDVYLWRIFKEINKIVHLPITIRHLLHETINSIVNCDNVATEMRQKTRNSGINCWNIDISKEVKKLNEVINNI